MATPLRTALISLVALGAAPFLAAQEEDPFGSLFGERQEPSEEDLPEEALERGLVLLARGRHAEAELLLALLKDEHPEAELPRLGLAPSRGVRSLGLWARCPTMGPVASSPPVLMREPASWRCR